MTPPLPVPPSEPQLEADSRFPSGPWCGFFLMSHLPGKHQMELHLTFRDGVVMGEGRDRIGKFLIRGRYQVENGECWWTKKYIGQHDVFYHGYNEGKGIWGLWDIPPTWKGGFHIWPEAMGDPTRQVLTTAEPVPVEEEMEAGELVEAAVGGGVESASEVDELLPVF